MISGEGLRRTPHEVLGTLLHEAAHALAYERGIKDTSRQGRYHNKPFKTCAEQLGLTVEHDDRFGWSAATITHATSCLRPPAPRPGRRHDHVAARRNHHRPRHPAQHQPHRGEGGGGGEGR